MTEAEKLLRSAMVSGLHTEQAYNELGVILAQQRRFDESAECLQRCLQLNPRFPHALNNLGCVFKQQEDFSSAERFFRQALRFSRPQSRSHNQIAYNLSEALLAQKNCSEGWPLFEARAYNTVCTKRIPVRKWDGGSLEGKRLFVVEEEGFGDAIQFLRFAPALRQPGTAATREGLFYLGSEALRPLVASMKIFDGVFPLDHPVPVSDDTCWCGVLSLPFLLGKRADFLLWSSGYIAADQERSSAWCDRYPWLAEQGRFKVGLTWAGSVSRDSRRVMNGDSRRSLQSYKELRPLWDNRNVRFVSLQIGDRTAGAMAAAANQPLENLGCMVRDFADTAAILAHLDLVISVDTAVAHLAGALRRPVWTLLPVQADWRWHDGLDRSRTLWYPTMRLFRQMRPDDWHGVIEQVAAELSEAAVMSWA